MGHNSVWGSERRKEEVPWLPVRSGAEHQGEGEEVVWGLPPLGQAAGRRAP